jgi:hypothetical protein
MIQNGVGSIAICTVPPKACLIDYRAIPPYKPLAPLLLSVPISGFLLTWPLLSARSKARACIANFALLVPSLIVSIRGPVDPLLNELYGYEDFTTLNAPLISWFALALMTLIRRFIARETFWYGMVVGAGPAALTTLIVAVLA